MNQNKYLRYVTVIALSGAVCLPALAADDKKEKSASGQPSEAEMAMMMELAKPGANHKMLEEGVGSWTYTVKMWMNPDAPAMESSGTSVARAVFGGRYVITEHTGKMQMPGADGKMQDMEFKGMATEGYDNAKKKFVSSWIDNMGTGVMYMEGTYDPATKTLTYSGEYEMIPGTKTKVRETIKFSDKNHRTFEFYEDRGGKEVRTMELNYTRKS
jgi:Protein of unknown function (DUF1579)